MGLANDLPELLRRWGDSRQARVFTALPARVKTYDAATQTADLEIVVRAPLVREENEEDVAHEPLPVIPNVRILFPSTGTACITWPIPVGTEVLFVVSSLALGEYRRTGEPADAVDLRRNALGCSGWAIPGVLKDSALLPSAETNALVLEHGTAVRVGKDATEKIVRDDLARARIQELADAILNATPVANDGGAAIQTAAKATLLAAGWGAGGIEPPSMGADKGYVE